MFECENPRLLILNCCFYLPTVGCMVPSPHFTSFLLFSPHAHRVSSVEPYFLFCGLLLQPSTCHLSSALLFPSHFPNVQARLYHTLTQRHSEVKALCIIQVPMLASLKSLGQGLPQLSHPEITTSHSDRESTQSQCLENICRLWLLKGEMVCNLCYLLLP